MWDHDVEIIEPPYNSPLKNLAKRLVSIVLPSCSNRELLFLQSSSFRAIPRLGYEIGVVDQPRAVRGHFPEKRLLGSKLLPCLCTVGAYMLSNVILRYICSI